MAEETDRLYNVYLGKTGRTPGVYLDEVERRQLEDYRAQIEGREPDYENLDVGYTPLTREPVDTHNMSNVSAARDPQDPQPVVVITREVFDSPRQVNRTANTYADRLANVNTARAAAAPMGAAPGEYDDGGHGGPDFLNELGSQASEKDQDDKEKEAQRIGEKAASAVKVESTNLKASDAVTSAPENQPRKRATAKKTAAKKTTSSKAK